MITNDDVSDTMEAKRLAISQHVHKRDDSLERVGNVSNHVGDSTSYDADKDAKAMIRAAVEVLMAAMQTIEYEEDERNTWHAVAPLEAAALRCIEAMALCWYHVPELCHNDPPRALHPPGTKVLEKLERLGVMAWHRKTLERHVAVVPPANSHEFPTAVAPASDHPQHATEGQTEDAGAV